MSNESTVSDTENMNKVVDEKQSEIDNVLDEVIDKANKTYYQEGLEDTLDKFQIKIPL